MGDKSEKYVQVVVWISGWEYDGYTTHILNDHHLHDKFSNNLTINLLFRYHWKFIKLFRKLFIHFFIIYIFCTIKIRKFWKHDSEKFAQSPFLAFSINFHFDDNPKMDTCEHKSPYSSGLKMYI